MKQYQVGPDEFDEFDWKEMGCEEYVWCVYSYEQGSYDGDGVAVAKREDGKFDYGTLAHCSCYGPTDHWLDGTVDRRGILALLKSDEGGKPRQVGDFDGPHWLAVAVKVRKLLGVKEK